MKRFKSLFYVLALALIFVGAAGVTKVSASSVETYKLTWNVPANCSVKVYVSQSEIESGTSLNEGAEVDITLSAPSGFVMEVTSSDVELTKFGQGYSFEMPAKAVNLTISMGPETQTPSSGTGTLKAEPNYNNETIAVTSDKQIYYQIVKSADQKTGLKTANWIEAAYDGTNKVYCIDFSGTANGKDAFFALTTDSTKGDATEVVVVDAVIKSVKVGLNYMAETISAKGLTDIITTLNVKGVEKDDDKADGTAADYQLKWKRGANGAWAVATAFTQLEWDMLKASNGTLYVAIDGKVKAAEEGKEVEVTSFRLSKEAKVKIPKSAKAPTVKVDYVKGTLALKNGMQVRVNDNTAWLDVIAYDKAAEDKGAFALATANLKTSKKVSTVAVADFVAAIRDEKLLNMDIEDGAEITVTARTAATDKKFPSMEGTMKLVLPEAEPAMTESTNIRCTAADKTNDVKAEFEINFADLMLSAEGIKYEEYEYALVGKIADGVNLLKQKWTKIPSDGKVDLAKSIGKDYSWFKEGEDKATKFKYEDMDGILVRKAAVKATKEVTGVFASAYRTIDVTVMVTESESSSQNPGDDTEWDIKNGFWNIISFYVGENSVEKAKPGTKVKIVVNALSMPQYVVDKVTVYLYYGESYEEATVIQADANGEYYFTMPIGHVTVVVSEKNKDS